MTEGVLRIRFLGSKTETDKAYYRRTRIRKIVESVRRYRNGTAYKTGDEFSAEKKNVYYDSDDSAKIAIGGADILVFIIFAVFNK